MRKTMLHGTLPDTAVYGCDAIFQHGKGANICDTRNRTRPLLTGVTLAPRVALAQQTPQQRGRRAHTKTLRSKPRWLIALADCTPT